MECIKQDPVSLNRILWLDALKCFAMFLVIWGHVIQYGVTDYLENDIHIGIYSFHMPLFMMISGFFAGNIAKYSFGKFLKIEHTHSYILHMDNKTQSTRI